MIENNIKGGEKGNDLTFLQKKLDSVTVLYHEKDKELIGIDDEISTLTERSKQLKLRIDSVYAQMRGLTAKIRIIKTIDGEIELDTITNTCFKLSQNSYFKTRGLKNSTSSISSIVIEILSMDNDMKNCQMKKECININTLSDKIKKGKTISNTEYNKIKKKVIDNF